jgi:hypothetical protein
MRVTSFMLADAAQDVGGKIYVLGGGWNLIFVNPANGLPIRHPQITLVALLSVEWNEANETISFSVNLVNEDGASLIPEPLSGQLTIGRPSQIPKGTDQIVPLVINFPDLSFERFGTYSFIFNVGEQEHARAPFHIIAAKQ